MTGVLCVDRATHGHNILERRRCRVPTQLLSMNDIFVIGSTV
jgi:hypothetical protein